MKDLQKRAAINLCLRRMEWVLNNDTLTEPNDFDERVKQIKDLKKDIAELERIFKLLNK